ncbi:MAG: GNAT family N-acetyltransferase [Bacteroidetes bacterium]|nr:GNAT family N-acetyltransferase [Bacteroidota bacterium]
MESMRPATTADIPIIRQLAKAIWPPTFKDILSESQIAYMLRLMYAEASLEKQMRTFGHCFFLLIVEEEACGFMSLEHDVHHQGKTRIHKIYLLPKLQGKGLGAKMIQFAAKEARQKGDSALILNVNKYNTAAKFYEKLGFELVKEEVIPIGEGFVMDDFVFEKTL